MSQAKVLHFQEKPVILWMRGSEPLIESQHLATLLGYVQAGSIRKQVRSDWKEEFLHLKDFQIIHNEMDLRAYENLEVLHLGKCKPAKLKRGRLFLTITGLKKLLTKSSKTTPELRVFFQVNVLDEGVIELNPSPTQPAPLPVIPPFEASPRGSRPPGHIIGTSSTSSSREDGAAQGDSKTKYQAIQQLLHNLKEHEETELQELAIEAAELMLERRLDDIRKKFLGQEKSKALPKTDGPLFEQEGWYGCKQIGTLAGGYSSTTAGKAATVVGERWGFSSHQIRKKKLSFNKLVEAPDTNGRLRLQFRFNKGFSNEVILELRNNPYFSPMQEIPAQLELEASPRRYPNLSKPIFEEEEETSKHMESFFETLLRGLPSSGS